MQRKIEATDKELQAMLEPDNHAERIARLYDLVHERNGKWLMDLRPGWVPKSKIWGQS